MLNKYLSEISQNKNLLMLLTAGIYSIALYSVLSEQILLFSMLLLLISIIAIVKNYFPCKYIIVWNLLFYLGILNTSCRIKDVDELLSLAPVNCEISGTVVSIPKGKTEGTFKFFFEVDKLNIKKSLEKKFDKEKVLVTLNSTTGTEDLKLYSSLRLKGRLSMPFKAGNPSQFDYGNYLRNHNAYSVFYAKSFEHIDKHLSVKAKILRSINDYRENIIKKHSKYLASPNLEILGGIVFGDDAVSPSKDIKDSFVASGLLHILAASGMNVAFIYGFFFWILNLLKVNYKINVLFLSIAL